MSKSGRKRLNNNHLFALGGIFLLLSGLFMIWISTLRIPALQSISERRIDRSTKIYDRTGEILLYDFSQDVRRKTVPLSQISSYAQKATIAIEDKNFYNHNGFVFSSFMRALWANIRSFSFKQGGSTITQQVVKNSILTLDKTPTRKLKEIILALKLERTISKDEILSLYLNEIPYGGTVYGIEEASKRFFGKSAVELNLPESAYLAAIPQAPTFYSPYGKNRQELETRKNLVLSEMLKNGFINNEEYELALKTEVIFKPRENTGSIKAPHFVFFVIDELVKKFGEESLTSGGYKVVTTLDYSIQEKAEATSKKYGEINQKTFNANNNAIVVIDPKNGEILAMVGSRDYFDQDIGGNFNATLGLRQPGSTFKPFAYAELLNKGFTDKTILFDVPMQFSTNCPADLFITNENCYSPGNYDDRFRGPMTIRDALAQSINVPAVQAVYLAGLKDSISLASNMGITSLTDTNQYGLSIVLGGGAVSLLELTSAYSVFANDGVRNPYTSIIFIEDSEGDIIDRYIPYPQRTLSEDTSRTISSILSDNVARTPGYGPNSPLYVPYRDVAVKTGTSNDYRDAWIVGYSPNLVVGAWVGNNDNSPMEKKVAGLIVSPLWREVIDNILPSLPAENFPPKPDIDYSELKPVLRGEVDPEPHSILFTVDKNDPRGPSPSNPANDPQFYNWEYAVRKWSFSQTPSQGPQSSE